jgi:outer membrane scaffolding protein for murein synthesis (MipA/OmpV family)
VILDGEAEHWEVFGYGEVASLPGTVKDSPMVSRSSACSLTVGLTYTF